MTQINGREASNANMRESTYRLSVGCPNLAMALQTDAVIGVFQRGLQAYLQAAESAQLAQSLSLLYPMLETLPNLAQIPHPSSSAPKSFSDQSNHQCISAQYLTKFLQTLTLLYSTHLLLSNLPSCSLWAYPSGWQTVSFKWIGRWTDEGVLSCSHCQVKFHSLHMKRRPVKMTSAQCYSGALGVHEGMGEFGDEGGRATQEWLADDHIPSMMANYDWQMRHAGLMAITAIEEGRRSTALYRTSSVLGHEKRAGADRKPCTHVQGYTPLDSTRSLSMREVIQELYHQQLFSVFMLALENPEARVHSHTAAALINFCEGIKRDTLLPYLDPIAECLLKLLNPSGDQPQHYASIIPLLLDVLQNAEGPTHNNCVPRPWNVRYRRGRDVFRLDATKLVELLMQSHPDQTDAMVPEFEPYFLVVMPSLLTTASAKADISVCRKTRSGIIGKPTSAIDEKCQALETLVIYCSTLSGRFAPNPGQTLELALPPLKFTSTEVFRKHLRCLSPCSFRVGGNTIRRSSHRLTNPSRTLRTLEGVQALPQEFIEGMVQAEHEGQLFSVLIPALEDQNLNETHFHHTSTRYFIRVLAWREWAYKTPEAAKPGRRPITSTAVCSRTTIAMAAGASEAPFVKELMSPLIHFYFHGTMPQLCHSFCVLKNAQDPAHHKFAPSLWTIAVGHDVFRLDLTKLVKLLPRIQQPYMTRPTRN
ncbi:hypothetical protein BDN72DRAFT_859067 [Pluteus cervinus]|uniref:Uncharacterized protein n=1 Tax=Pluteus cervinus TaxID=181527 RepID=A0ACD3APU2_9AGAR|nr:hypothetical protein BDN72DRAFT_859067 [Pluteus cervinus]